MENHRLRGRTGQEAREMRLRMENCRVSKKLDSSAASEVTEGADKKSLTDGKKARASQRDVNGAANKAREIIWELEANWGK